MSPGKSVQPQKGTATRAGADVAKRKSAPRIKRPAAARRSGDGKRMPDAQERCRMIAISAYHRAERRGFEGGSPEQDWLEAEAEIDQMLATTGH